jgi:hypothetical protein
MRLFGGAVHAGNAGAKAIGPCPVDISNIGGWGVFLAAGGGQWCDEISFHDYNSMTNGNLGLGRKTIEAFQALLTQYGLSGKTLWQTEAGGAFKNVYGVHHPRRARVKILHTLLWEQYGIPRERNVLWYDRSHGYWPFPCWWQFGDGSLTADATLHRVLAEETFGLTHSARFSLGKIGDRIALGSIYSGASGSCVVLLATSYFSNATATLAIAGTSGSLTVVDAFGSTTTLAIVDGKITVPISDIPTYVRLPVGATATIYKINDWPPASLLGAWASSSSVAKVIANGTNPSAINDDALMSSYGGGNGMFIGLYTMPDSVVLDWTTATRVDRVIVWNQMSWQLGPSFVDFDVQTGNDGTTWTTQATVTRPTPTSFLFGTNSTNTWGTQETYWDEQWVFDVPLATPVTCRYLRVFVRSTSYGGEPDAAATAAGGQGDGSQRIAVQEIAVLCDANVYPQLVRFNGS